MLHVSKNDRLLIIAPHPDDEVIGCGGLIQKVKKAGGKVFVLFLTVGDTKDFTKKGLSTLTEREKEIKKVARFLAYDKYHIAFSGNEYHLKLDVLGQTALMNMIERESPLSIQKCKPTIVVFPSVHSYNQDHKIAAVATHASLRTSSKEKHFVRAVLSYEEAADFWTTGEVSLMNVFVSLSEAEYKRKLIALKKYSSQWREFPSSRAEEVITSLTTIRGGQTNTQYAESYVSYRLVL